MWLELGLALALMLVLEGLTPTLSPETFRRMLLGIAQLDNRTIRMAGLISMVLGAVFVYVLRHV